jgi:hypothetical protein
MTHIKVNNTEPIHVQSHDWAEQTLSVDVAPGMTFVITFRSIEKAYSLYFVATFFFLSN